MLAVLSTDACLQVERRGAQLAVAADFVPSSATLDATVCARHEAAEPRRSRRGHIFIFIAEAKSEGVTPIGLTLVRHLIAENNS
jgi:hypothetical protein